jgi:hypothetical protein
MMVDTAATWQNFDRAWHNATPEQRDRVIDKIRRYTDNDDEARDIFEMITGHNNQEDETQR